MDCDGGKGVEKIKGEKLISILKFNTGTEGICYRSSKEEILHLTYLTLAIKIV